MELVSQVNIQAGVVVQCDSKCIKISKLPEWPQGTAKKIEKADVVNFAICSTALAWATKQSEIGIFLFEQEATWSVKADKTSIRKMLFSNTEDDLRKSQYSDEKRQSLKLLPLLAVLHQEGLDIMLITDKRQLQLVSKEPSLNIRSFCFHRQRLSTIFNLTNSAEVYQVDNRRNGGFDRRCILPSTSFIKNEPTDMVAGKQQLFISCTTQRKSNMVFVFKLEDQEKPSGFSEPIIKLRIIDDQFSGHQISFSQFEDTSCLMVMSPQRNHIQLYLGSDIHNLKSFSQQLPEVSLCQAVDLQRKTPEVLIIYPTRKEAMNVVNFNQVYQRRDSIEETELINQLKQPPTVVRQITFGRQDTTATKKQEPATRSLEGESELQKQKEKLNSLKKDISLFRTNIERYIQFYRQRIRYGGPMPFKIRDNEANNDSLADVSELIQECRQMTKKTRKTNLLMRTIQKQYVQSKADSQLSFILNTCDNYNKALNQLSCRLYKALPQRDAIVRNSLWQPDKQIIAQSYERNFDFEHYQVGRPNVTKNTISL